MAAPITHVFFAEEFINDKLSPHNQTNFIVGTLFPDIRYYDNMDRQRTHLKKIVFSDLKKENSFDAGLKFHSFLDEQRMEFFESREDYPFFLGPMRAAESSLKFFEDEILYERIKDWPRIKGCLDDILPEELYFSLREQDVRGWHRLLKEYFSQTPTDQSRENLLRGMGFLDDTARQINLHIQQIKSEERIKRAVDEFIEGFSDEIKNGRVVAPTG